MLICHKHSAARCQDTMISYVWDDDTKVKKKKKKQHAHLLVFCGVSAASIQDIIHNFSTYTPSDGRLHFRHSSAFIRFLKGWFCVLMMWHFCLILHSALFLPSAVWLDFYSFFHHTDSSCFLSSERAKQRGKKNPTPFLPTLKSKRAS